MNEEKMLIKVEDLTIFQRICNFLKRIFFRRKKKSNFEIFEENIITDNSEMIEEQKIEEQKIVEEKNETKESIMEKVDNSLTILEIQEQYEQGLIKEEELSEEEKEELAKLYETQIQTIEDDIVSCIDQIEYFKTKIEEVYNS